VILNESNRLCEWLDMKDEKSLQIFLATLL